MISWLIIGIFVVLGVIVLKVNHLRHRFWIIALIIIALFFYLTITVVHNKYALELDSTAGVFNAVKIYLGWLGMGFQNMKTLTGNAIHMDWVSSNQSLIDIGNSSSGQTDSDIDLDTNPNVNPNKNPIVDFER